MTICNNNRNEESMEMIMQNSEDERLVCIENTVLGFQKNMHIQFPETNCMKVQFDFKNSHFHYRG